ncbi:MAG: hypothetical protein RR986_02830 [Longicatena sp.]
MNLEEIKKKTKVVIETQLWEKGYATTEDTLVAMGWLSKEKLGEWKQGKIPYLERVCNTNLNKITQCMKTYHNYAKEKQYKMSRTSYIAMKTKKPLRFSKSGNPNIESRYAQRILAGATHPRKQIEEKK